MQYIRPFLTATGPCSFSKALGFPPVSKTALSYTGVHCGISALVAFVRVTCVAHWPSLCCSFLGASSLLQAVGITEESKSEVASIIDSIIAFMAQVSSKLGTVAAHISMRLPIHASPAPSHWCAACRYGG